MKTQAPILVWFRHDFRISDNPALFFAASQNRSVIPVFIWSDHETSLGAASRWWLSNSILAFRQQLRAFGSDLALRKGKPKDVFRQLLSETKATSIFFNRRFEPELWRQDQEFQSHFEDRLDIQSFPGNYLFEPGKISNKGQKPYQVFSAFYRAALKYADEEGPRTVLAPESLLAPRVWPKSDTILELREALAMKWAKKFEGHWKVGENAAEEMWNKFCATQLLTYSHDRNFPSIAGTSCLSPYLHFGQISPRKMFYDLQSSREESRVEFLRQLIWREFCISILFHFPRFSEESFIPKLRSLTWKKNQKFLRRWQKGRTGYPIVDAGMHELWQTGFMHNRVRMIVGSFLTKHLGCDWRAGAEWFWDTLVDADLANNSFGWQWVASTGIDPVPYFRIFNPVLQSKKFDPEGIYLRKWLPELSGLSNRWIHFPELAPAEDLKAARIVLGKTYPRAIVQHEKARAEALRRMSRRRSESV